jgi:hypothetical protein
MSQAGSREMYHKVDWACERRTGRIVGVAFLCSEKQKYPAGVPRLWASLQNPGNGNDREGLNEGNEGQLAGF